MTRWATSFAILVGLAGRAVAGGLYLPGPGAITTSRAGAAVASVDTGEAIVVNPAGLAKTEGWTLTLSTALIDHSMTFQRRGTYDDIPGIDLPYEGQPYPLVEDGSKAALGIGQFQPIPVITVTGSFKAVPKLRLAFGLYAPNAYPYRDMCTRQPNGDCKKYEFNADPNEAPSPARYDVVSRSAALFLPTLAASYRVLPNLDVGARFGIGYSTLKSSVHVWSAPGNVVEDVGGDGLLEVEASDGFVPAYGVGFAYRPTPSIEIGGTYNSEILIEAKGTANSTLGPRSGSGGIQVMVQPVPDEFAQCAKGGRVGALKACIAAQLPRSATLGGRYKFLGKNGLERGDLELNVGWENWGDSASTDFRVKIDSEIGTAGMGGVAIKENVVRHGFQDVFNARLGGSWRFPIGSGSNMVIARGGVGHDTAAARPGWMRADIDGSSRTTITAGAGYRTKRFQVDAGFGMVLSTRTDNKGECNPISPQPADQGCNRDGVQQPLDDRQGPDPINPLIVPEVQLEAPVNRGVFEGHYILIMIGATTWF